jgi:pimeloyl-ACP methyl ester carboxylesterase
VARHDVNGIEIDYELVGDGGAPVVVLTPGGRFPRDVTGIREFADALVAGGRRVLMWDRPNCGASDMHFGRPSESDVQADALVGLLRALDLGPVTLTGGSGGARVVMIAAARDPSLVGHLAIWWISGGPISLAQLAAYYCGDSAIAAARGGMAAVLALPSWAEQLARNPRNRDIVLAQDPDVFIETMQRWALAYAYSETSPVPGMVPADYARLTMPVRVYRSGKSDMSHTRRTSEWVHELIPGSTLAEPPWGDQEWNERSVSPDHALFRNWSRLAPEILAFSA